MKLPDSLRAFARALFHRSTTGDEMEAELHSHIQHRADDLQRSGLSRTEAERRARLEFGGFQRFKEDCHEAAHGHFIATVLQDVRFGLRMLLRSPGFTAVVVLTLALGIGANTAIFSLVNAVMLRSLPVRNPGQLVVLRWSAHKWPQSGNSSYGDCESSRRDGSDYNGCSFSYPLFRQIRSQIKLFSNAMAFAGPAGLDLSGNGPASITEGELVSGNYFQTLGVSAALGRTLEHSDEQPGAPPVVVLEYGYWQRAFAGSPNAIGKTIRLNNLLFTIVGVADPAFTRLTPGQSVQMWLPLSQVHALGLPWGGSGSDDGWWLTIVGRLRPGVSRSQAQAAVSLLVLNQTMHAAKPAWKSTDDPTITLVPAQKGLVGFRQHLGEPLFLLMAAVGIVLLIACANVAGLMLARGAAREKEMAVRLALGAARRRVVRQLLTESLLLSFAGALLGALLAYLLATGLAAFVAANSFGPQKIDLRLNLPVLLFAISAALLTGIGFGLAPALRGARTSAASELAGLSSSSTAATYRRGRRFGLGGSLVVLQVALSVVVLTGAGLLLRTLDKLRNVDPGFDTHNILLFSVNPSFAGYQANRIPELYQNLQQRLAVLPGVTSSSYSSNALLDGGLWTSTVHIHGQSATSSVDTQMLAVGSDFFQTMKIPLVRGRMFRPSDLRTSQPVAIVNQAFVRQFLGSSDPLGMQFVGTGAKRAPWQIIGVVANTKYRDLRSEDAPTAFVPLNDGGATFALRTAADPSALIPAVRNVVRNVDDNLPVINLKTQSEIIDRLLFNERLTARLFGLFGALGLLLACIGVYGLLSYEVARRTREIGIRAALGAQRSNLLLMVLKHGLVLVLFGSALGILASLAAARLLQSLLYGVRPTDPATFIAVCALLITVGVLACYLPARRATRVDPVVALRAE